jgi:hypothetical protein
MRYALPSLLVALVVTATVTAGAPVVPGATTADPGSQVPAGVDATEPLAATASTATEPIVTLSNGTSYLGIAAADRRRQAVGNATIDVAGTAAVESNRLHDQFLVSATLQAFESADNASARTAVVRAAVGDLENRTTALQRDQQQAISRYNDRELSTDGLFRELAVVDERARELESFLGTLLEVTSQRHGYSLPNTLRSRIHNARADPILLQGPVRRTVTTAMVGNGNAQSLLVRTSEEGVVLAQVAGDEFYREAFLGAQRRSGQDQFADGSDFPPSVATDRARTLYPWTFNNTITSGVIRYGQTSVYRIAIDHTQGTLTSYIDGTTTDAFREIQSNRLSALPLDSSRERTGAELAIRAELTHGTGPVRVTVSNPATGAEVDAAIRVNGQFVGQTGADGRLWTVHTGTATQINATTADGRSVALSLPAGPAFDS